jgi:hypothetical protein
MSRFCIMEALEMFCSVGGLQNQIGDVVAHFSVVRVADKATHHLTLTYYFTAGSWSKTYR